MHPTLANMLGDLWAMEPGALSGLMASLTNGDWKAAGMLEQEDDDAQPYSIDENGTMTIQITGTLMASVPLIFQLFGINATGYDEIRAAVAVARTDPKVKAVTLMIDSPGGSTSGIHAVADDLSDLNDEKPVTARVSGMAASAAYWIASQASKIYAERGSMIGSIGTYAVVRDSSVAAANAGIKVNVISSADLKGAGVPGAPVTDAQLADVRRMITAITENFVADVAIGRGKSTADILPSATGQLWMAPQAIARGLIDEEQTDEPPQQETTDMDAFALIEKHPAHAAMIAKMAKDGVKVEAMEAAITNADALAALANAKAETAKAQADLVTAKADAEALKVKLADAEKVRDQHAKQLTDLKAIAKGGAAGNKIAQDGEESKPEQISQAAFDAMAPLERAKFYARGGVVSAEAAT